jgi:hypothetical protein
LNLRRIRLVPSPAFFSSVRGLRRGGGEWRRASGRRPGSSRQDAQDIAPAGVLIKRTVHVRHHKASTISAPASFGLFRFFFASLRL